LGLVSVSVSMSEYISHLFFEQKRIEKNKPGT
jgi:hypothetical protein